MPSGRPPKPTTLKLLEGTRPDRVNHNEPSPAPSTRILPPYQLSDDAQAVWDRLAPDLIAKGVLTAWDVELFATFCVAAVAFRECEGLLREHGYTAKGAAGGVIKSPYIQIMRDAAGLMSSIGSRFGLTPSDRAHLSVSKDDTEGERGAERLLS